MNTPHWLSVLFASSNLHENDSVSSHCIIGLDQYSGSNITWFNYNRKCHDVTDDTTVCKLLPATCGHTKVSIEMYCRPSGVMYIRLCTRFFSQNLNWNCTQTSLCYFLPWQFFRYYFFQLYNLIISQFKQMRMFIDIVFLPTLNAFNKWKKRIFFLIILFWPFLFSVEVEIIDMYAVVPSWNVWHVSETRDEWKYC